MNFNDGGAASGPGKADVADFGDEGVYVEPGANHARAVRGFEMRNQTPT